MRSAEKFNPTARLLRLSAKAEVILLVIAGFFLFTEHRAHFLGAAPYALAILALTLSFWLWAECRRTAGRREISGPRRQP